MQRAGNATDAPTAFCSSSTGVAAPGKAGHSISLAQGLSRELAAGRPVPASLGSYGDNCHKSNCSCWITSILHHHHHPQLPRASSGLLFQGRKAAPPSQERLIQAGSSHLKQSPRAEPLPTAVPVCKCDWGQGMGQGLSQEAAWS